jgi:4-oxalmesaconate hydratase
LAYRRSQIDYLAGGDVVPTAYAGISDAELISIVEANQLRLQRERGSNVTLLSPRASAMGHHLADEATARSWAELSNDVIAQICQLFPQNFAPVCQLPQTIDGSLNAAVVELERCARLGFVGCNVNPDPSGGRWESPPVTDPWWDPLWEAATCLDMTVMIHVSASASPALHTTGAHYLAADTVVFMQLLSGDLFTRFPTLRLVIPHGGGAVPYHWGRFRGLGIMLDKPPLDEHLMRNVFFDSCVYHQEGIDALFSVIDTGNILFGSELLGAVKAIDPRTGHAFDDTKRYIDALALDDPTRQAVLGGNARSVYPRLDALLIAQGR